MPKRRNILYRIYSPLVNASPDLFFSILKHQHSEMLINRLEIGLSCGLDTQILPEVIQGFQDLAFLFWSTPVNRGFIRQDIDEASALYEVVSRLENPTGVEIGRFNGGSTILLAAALGENGKLFSIDIDPPNDDFLVKILEQYGLCRNVQLIRGDANNVLIEEKTTFDFVFIDGDHSYEGARQDHNRWGAKVKTHGLIIHHDMGLSRKYATQHSDLSRLKRDILKTQVKELELISEVGSMCFFQRISTNWTPV